MPPRELHAIPWKIFAKPDVILIPYSAHLSQKAMRRFFRERGVKAQLFRLNGMDYYSDETVDFLDADDMMVLGPAQKEKPSRKIVTAFRKEKDVWLDLVRVKNY